MNIWEILNIEPTKDKKAIKKAYAKQSKIIHPEEKPDEFRMLHEAYKAALEYAKESRKEIELEKVSKQNSFSVKIEKKEESEKLIYYFQTNIISKEKKLAYFDEHWKKVNWKSMDSKSEEWWKEYLVSEEFKEIQWHPQVIHSLLEEIEEKLPHLHNLKIFLYEIYDFDKESEIKYEGEIQDLRKILHNSYVEHKKDEEWKKDQERIQQEYKEKKKKEELKKEKLKKYYRWIIPHFFLLICLAIPSVIYLVEKSKENYVIHYMEEKYPEAEFNILEKKKEEKGITSYRIFSSTHPDFQITVEIKNMNINIGSKKIEKTYEVEENYGLQLMEYYSGQYGLEYGTMVYQYDSFSKEKIYSILYYSDIENINEFSSKVTEMYQNQKELSRVGPIMIYKKDILYPEVMLEGGVEYFNIFERQFYEPGTISVSEMSQQIRQAYIIYMFNFEPWNLTEIQYVEYGPEYRKICSNLENYDGFWYTLHSSGKELYNIYIPIYQGYYCKEISIGNAYFFLLANDVKVKADEEGKGFYAEGVEGRKFFGNTAKINYSLFQQ